MRRVTVVLGLMLSQGCAHAQDQREALAAKGQVQDDWPKWQANVSKAELNGAVAPGTVFVWKNESTKITSRLALVELAKRIAWTGSAMSVHAVHVWTLEALPGGSTLVRTTESMDGFMLKRFYSSEQLAESLKMWLGALKKIAKNKGD